MRWGHGGWLKDIFELLSTVGVAFQPHCLQLWSWSWILCCWVKWYISFRSKSVWCMKLLYMTMHKIFNPQFRCLFWPKTSVKQEIVPLDVQKKCSKPSGQAVKAIFQTLQWYDIIWKLRMYKVHHKYVTLFHMIFGCLLWVYKAMPCFRAVFYTKYNAWVLEMLIIIRRIHLITW